MNIGIIRANDRGALTGSNATSFGQVASSSPSARSTWRKSASGWSLPTWGAGGS